MSGLLGPDGLPIRSYKKASPPKLGEAFTERPPLSDWVSLRLPNGGMIQFDLNQLTLQEYRAMRDHYQINASLATLTFMMHQLDWTIECDNERIRKHCEDNMRELWTRLVRALSQAFWAGYSPCILQWENEALSKTIQLTKVKDLPPETARVNWKKVEGYAPPGYVPPKLSVYDGIKQDGLQWPIPTENTLWYPLLMENGNYYGKKLLRPAFTSWYFSLLVHMFANRYFERFGEPVPVGRAPYEEEVTVDGKKIRGIDLMVDVLKALRSRSAVVLPDEKTQRGNDWSYDYQIEYLESQMRGADFERYLMRLDEEMSLALFTPLLILRTADVGSYNLGTTHMHVYMQMLNAISGDWKEYIDRYVLRPMVNYNFSKTSPSARIVFRKLGNDKQQLVVTLLQALISSGKAMPDLKELGEIAGLTVDKTEELTSREGETDPGETDPENDDSGSGGGGTSGSDSTLTVANEISARVRAQFIKAFKNRTIGKGFSPSMGYRRKLEDAFKSSGKPQSQVDQLYATCDAWLADAAELGDDLYGTADVVADSFDKLLSDQIGEKVGASESS